MNEVFAILGLWALLLSRFHGWSWLFLELIWVGAGQLEEARRPEAQPGEGHLGGEEERRKAQHVEAGLGEGQHREVRSGKGQLGEPGARDGEGELVDGEGQLVDEEGQLEDEEGQLGDEEGQLGEARRWEAQPGVDLLGEALQVLRSELDRRARCCPDCCRPPLE